MSQAPQNPDALAALERLYAKKVITLEEGQAAARLLAQDEAYPFPAPRPSPAPAAKPTSTASPPPADAPSHAEAPAGHENGDGTSPQ